MIILIAPILLVIFILLGLKYWAFV